MFNWTLGRAIAIGIGGFLTIGCGPALDSEDPRWHDHTVPMQPDAQAPPQEATPRQPSTAPPVSPHDDPFPQLTGNFPGMLSDAQIVGISPPNLRVPVWRTFVGQLRNVHGPGRRVCGDSEKRSFMQFHEALVLAANDECAYRFADRPSGSDVRFDCRTRWGRKINKLYASSTVFQRQDGYFYRSASLLLGYVSGDEWSICDYAGIMYEDLR